MTGMTPDWLFLVVIYLITVIVNTYAVFLYHKAYLQMHKTRMICSVFYLLFTMLLSNIYFLIITVFNGFNIINIFDNPIIHSIPAMGIITGLLYFIYASLSPNKYPPSSK